MQANDILPKLQNVRKTQKGWIALCPLHNDKKQSLSISENDGKILLKCFAGCQTSEIVSALGLEMKDLFDEKSNSFQPKKKIVATYDYIDEKGTLLFQSVRFEPKGFTQRKPNGKGGFDYNLNGVRRVLYRLPEVLRAEMVFIVEGEKDVETLRKQGYTATCNAGGALKWRDEYSEFLRDKTAVIMPDNDETGRKHALQVGNSLYGIAREILILDLPNLKLKGDVSDFFADGGTIDDIISLIERAESFEPKESETTSDEDFEQTEIKPFPVPSEKCFHGLAGDFIRLVLPYTEADAGALLVQFLAYFGNLIGHSAHYKIEGDKHFTNLFCVLVGDTASGRKGTSLGRVKECFKSIDQYHEQNCLVGGLASGEGLIYHVRDAQFIQKKNKSTGELEETQIDAGVSDKRLLVVEGEFAQVLRVQGREGNTLSAFLRNLWDSGTARNLTKNSPLKTTDAHVSIIGHVTKTELLTCLNETESANGYANRFLWFSVRRSKFLPLGAEGVNEYKMANFQRELAQKVDFARSAQRIIFNSEARKLWTNVYQNLETSRFGFLAKVTQRASAYVCRLACIFALLDSKDEIEREHLEAALAIWQYAEDSARYIFGERLGDKNAETILSALQNNADGLTRTEIRDVFDRHLSKTQIDAALCFLLENGLANREKIQTAGKPKEVWKLCDKSDKSDKSDKNFAGNVANVANVANETKNNLQEKEFCPMCDKTLSTTNNGQMFCDICLYTK